MHAKRRLTRLIELDFVRFCIVGGSGFVINFILLSLLHHFLHVPIYIAQFIGAEVALFSNFVLHNTWTYKRNTVRKSYLRLITEFHATSWPAIVGSTIMVTGFVKFMHLGNLPALMISSIIALGWNFAWSKFVIWRDVSLTVDKDT